MSSVDYNVNAWMRARGDFARQMGRQAAAVTPVQKAWTALGQKTSSVGRAIMGTTASTAVGYGKMAAAIGAISAVAGFSKLVHTGARFNAVMEETKLSIAAMFQLYKQNGGDLQKNIAQAAGAQRELFDMAKKSPVEFEDAVNIYQGAASGLIVANQSMQEQMEFMRGAQMLGAVVPDLESKVIGGQVGRILMGGAGQEFEVWKRLAPTILEAGKAADYFAKRMNMGEKFTQQFNKLAQAQPELAADLIKTALEPMKKMQEEFERSWGGILSTTKSNLKLVAAAFTGPFHMMRKKVLYDLNKTGLFSESNLGKLEHIAVVLGVLFSSVMERVFNKLMSWVTFLRDNWESILTTMYSVGQQVGMLIKGAFFVGVARMAAGAGVMAAGGAMRAGGAVRRAAPGALDYVRRKRRALHTGMARGALAGGKGRGLTGFMGKFLGQVSALSSRGPGAMKFMLSMGSLAGIMVAGAAAAAIFIGAIMIIAVVVAGIAAYIISNWDAIAASIVKALESGELSLVPFLVAMYTFWERLKAVGEALIGGSSGAAMFTGLMKLGIEAFNLMGGAISMTMKAIAIMVGIWGLLKLAMQGVVRAILAVIEVAAYLPGGPSDETVALARHNYEQYKRGVQDTVTTVEQLMRKADAIEAIDVSALDIDFDAMAKDWKEKLIEALKKKEEEARKPRGPQVNVQQVTINQDLRDTDPDRLMAHFIKPLERMADQRVQSYEALDMGE